MHLQTSLVDLRFFSKLSKNTVSKNVEEEWGHSELSGRRRERLLRFCPRIMRVFCCSGKEKQHKHNDSLAISSPSNCIVFITYTVSVDLFSVSLSLHYITSRSINDFLLFLPTEKSFISFPSLSSSLMVCINYQVNTF